MIRDVARFTDLLEARNALFDGVEEWNFFALGAAKSKGETIYCHGCSSGDCCYQLVAATFVSAIPIAAALQREGRDDQHLRKALLADSMVREREISNPGVVQHRACPFLSANHRCTIYEDRPVTCRAYWSMSSPEHCKYKEEGSNKVRTIDYGSPSEAEFRLALGIAADLGNFEQPEPWYRPLSSLVLLALEIADVYQGERFWLEFLPRAFTPRERFVKWAEHIARENRLEI